MADDADEFKTAVKLKVAALSQKGEGIAFFNGDEIYLTGVLPDEEVVATLGDPFVAGSKRRPGKVLQLKQANPCRNTHPCPYVQNCGGCSLGLYDYASQLETKANDVRAVLAELNLPLELFDGMRAHHEHEAWRHKSIRYFEMLDGKLKQGFYAPRTHRLCPISHCQAEPSWMSEFALTLENCPNTDIYPIRAVLMRNLGEHRLAVLISKSKLSHSCVTALGPLVERFSLNSLQELVHEGDDNALLKGNLQILYGSAYVPVTLAGFTFDVGAQTFLQVNPGMTERMYQDAVQFCRDGEKSGVALDLCCGVGTMSLMLSRHFSRVLGVEVVPQSVKAAQENARQNSLSNLEFIASDLSSCLSDLLSPDVVAIICDPSRVGIGEQCCRLLGRVKKGCRLSYIFCSLKALRRDLPCLIKAGFRVERISGYDMFPYTRLQETMVCLTKH